jgi:hypothetical protein
MEKSAQFIPLPATLPRYFLLFSSGIERDFLRAQMSLAVQQGSPDLKGCTI